MIRGRSACVLFVFAACSANAVDISGRVGAGVIQSDNIARTSADPRNDTIEEVTADFLLHEQSRRIAADVRGSLQYLDYVHNTFSSNVVGDVAGTGRFSVIPDRFDWEVQDNFGQQRLTPGAAETPENRQNVNFFSTGPKLSFNLTQLFKLDIEARYSKVSFQTTDDNNDRTGGNVSLMRIIDPASSMSLIATTESVRYSNDVLNPDFRRNQAFVRYQSKGGRTKLVADLGYDSRTGDAGKYGTALYRLELSRELSPSSNISIFAGKEGSDVGSLLRQLQYQVPQLQGTGQVQRSTDPFSNQYLRAAWAYSRNRTAVYLNASRSKERHSIQFLADHTTTGVSVGLQRRLSRGLTASIGGSLYKNEYALEASNSRQVLGSAGIAWRATRLVDVRLEYQHLQQSSPVVLNRYTENRALLSVGVNWDPPVK